jgi:protein-tyrosine phosphatase
MIANVPMPGFIDLHSHLLPGIDDGCVTLEQSLACVRRLIERGFVGTVCTPHIWLQQFPANVPANISRWVDGLREALDAVGLEYGLWPGGEVRIARDTVEWFEEHGVPTLGPSRAVLIDYWGRDWPDYGDRVIEYLLDAELQPVLAHPERMDFPDAEWHATIDRLQALGVWLQGNLRCIAGGEGPQPQRRMRGLLTEDRYHLVATDMHGPVELDGRLAGMHTIEQTAGAAGLRALLAERPAEMLRGM